MTFYRDDRQVLFWDRSAQRQLLRSLFLPLDEAAEWTRLERLALRADSEHRNWRNAVGRRAQEISILASPSTAKHKELLAEYTTLSEEDEQAAREGATLLDSIREIEEELSKRRLEALRAELSEDELGKEYEHAKLARLAQHFPSASESALYVWTQLLSEDECLVCGAHDVGLQSQIDVRLATSRCPICASPLDGSGGGTVNISEERLARLVNDRLSARESTRSLNSQVVVLQAELDAKRVLASELELLRAIRTTRIAAIRSKLPQDDAAYARMLAELSGMQLTLERLAVELGDHARRFENYVQKQSARIATNADEIKRRFEKYAKAFLLEQSEMTWSPRQERIGQSSYFAMFPAFELQMARNDGGSVSLRNGDEDVSESQKEFIDLAFRMALIDVASEGSGGMVLVDTPESSLDSVFADRAADALAAFVRGKGIGLVIASNVTGSSLIPRLIELLKKARVRVAVVDLFDVARATTAINRYRKQYQAAVRRLLRDA
ncbi:hypothetical protein ACFPJ4_03580 [Lysinimonas soli]|uniref:Uncharacterized protein n=1 Tax=Lysinimonas soli TaxID=1074233 RepID=A0ABW0NNH5_9MICO